MLWSLITTAIILFMSCWVIGKSIISCSEKCELNITSSCIQVRKSIINILSKINLKFMHNYWSLWCYMYIKEQCFNSFFENLNANYLLFQESNFLIMVPRSHQNIVVTPLRPNKFLSKNIRNLKLFSDWEYHPHLLK